MGASTPSMPRYTPSELPQPPGATELPAWPWDRVQFDGSESLPRQSLHGFSCPLPGGALPLETRTQGDDNLVQVAHHILLHFVGLDNDHCAPMRRQRRFDVLEAKTHQAVSRLHNDGVNLRVLQYSLRRPFRPEPTSLRPSATRKPGAAANGDKRDS